MEHWDGTITSFVDYGSHCEVRISSRSGFTFIVGKYSCGGFISIPAFDVGSDLASFNDYFWNCERLAAVMSPVDAATVAEALRTLSNYEYI